MKRIFISCFILFAIPLFAQVDQQIGRTRDQFNSYYGNFYDYSDPTTINVKVSIWGYVRSPGKYIVPIYTTVPDLISYAGGPVEESNLDDVRIYRVDKNANEEIIKLNYTDLLHEDQLNKNKVNPNLKAGDILIIPGSPKYYFTNYLNISLSILSAIVSLTILVITINNN
ncbi:MAG: SLBB domain-containing protein [Nitrososphaeraceae archaeon]